MASTRRISSQGFLLAALAAFLLLPILLVPLNSDNDTYQAMAFTLTKGRGLPYLGSWDQNFPGVVFYHWLSMVLFGASDVSFRIVDLLNFLTLILITYALAQKHISARLAWTVVPCLSALYLSSGFWMLGQRDVFATTWLVLALYLLLEKARLDKHLLLAASCIAIASFIRPTTICFASLLLVNLRVRKSPRRDLSLFSIGLLGTVVFLLIPWILSQGGLQEFATATILFNRDVYSSSRVPLRQFIDQFSAFALFYVVALISVALAIFKYQLRNVGHHLLAYLTCGLVGVLGMGKYHIYHYAVFFPLLGLGFALMLELTLPSVKKYIVILSMLALVGYYYPRQIVAQYLKSGMDKTAQEHIANNLASFPYFSRGIETEVIKYLGSKHLNEDDVEFFLLWPALKWRAGYISHNRFTTTYALSMEGTKGLMPYQQQWRQEVAIALDRSRPKYVVAALGPSHVFTFSRYSSDSLIHLIPSIRELLERNYQVDTVIGGYKLYRRSDVAKID